MIWYIVTFKHGDVIKTVTVATNNLFILKLLMVKQGLIVDLSMIVKVTVIENETLVKEVFND